MDAASNVRTDGMASDGCQLPVRIGLDQIGYDEYIYASSTFL